MNDIFNEQLVRKLPSTKDAILKALIVCLGIILIFVFSIFLSGIAAILAVAVAYGVFYLMSFFKIEYEYTFTNGELDIDCIYSKSRRKRVFSANVRDFTLLSKIDNEKYQREFEGTKEMKDYSSGIKKDNTYFFIHTIDGKKTKFIFEPNEQIIAGIKKYMPIQNFHE